MKLSVLNNNLKAINRNFNRVNNGGCACVAAMLAVALRHTFPIMRITTCGNDYNDINLDKVRSNMRDRLSKREWSSNGVWFDHVWVEIYHKGRWYAIDSTGIYTRPEMYRMWDTPAKGSFSIDEIQALADTDSWNSSFNRNQLPAIQEYITATIT